MFICEICKVQQPSCTPIVKVVLETREKTYAGTPSDNGGKGNEIVREVKAYGICAIRSPAA